MFGQTSQPGAQPPGRTGFNFGGPTSTAPTPAGFSFGGSTGTTQPATAFGTAPAATSASAGFSLGPTATPLAGNAFQFSAAPNTGAAAAATPAPKPGFSFGGTGLATSGFAFGSTPAATNAGATPGLSITGLSTTPAAAPTAFGGGLKLESAATTPAMGLTLGAPAVSTTASPFQGFALGTSTATATPATGLTLGMPAATGLTLGTTPVATVSSTQGFKLGGTAAPATGATGLSLGTAATTSVPSLGLGGIKPVATVGVTSTTAGTPLSGFKAVGSTPLLGSTGLSTIKTAPTSSVPTAAFGVTPASSTAVAATSAGSTAVAATAPQLTYKQLEDQINKWTLELEDSERTFLDQAAQVNAWDRLLMENGEKITELNSGVESVKAEQKRLDEELNFITAQQRELEDLLKPLEDQLKKNTIAPGQMQHADREREFTYGLAKDIDGQLKQTVTDLKSVIDHLNTTSSTQQESEDPIVQVSKILNAHMDSLQWIDQNAALLQRKVDEVTSLSEIRRKDQERNFRLAFD